MSMALLAASVLLAMMVAYGVWLVVWGRRLLMRPEPTPRFATRWERQFTKWGVLDANAPRDAESQLLRNWMRITGQQNVKLGIASLIAAGTALLALILFRDVLPAVTPLGLYIPTFGPWLLALIVCIGKYPPYDVAHGDQAHPSLDSHKPWRLLLLVPASCAAIGLVYLALLTLIALGVLSPDQPPYYPGELAAASYFRALWIAPLLMLLVGGLSAYFVVQTTRKRPADLSGDPVIDQRAASKLRDYQLFRTEIPPGMLVFLSVQAESTLVPLHGSSVTDGILMGLMFAAFAVYLGALLLGMSILYDSSTPTATQGHSSPTPDTAL
jgi:hypothetical protein